MKDAQCAMRTANTTIQISKKHGTFAVNLLLKHFAKTLDFLDLIYFPILLSLVNIEFHFFNYSCDFLSRPNENIRKPLNTLPHWQEQLLHTNCPLEETAKTNKWPNLKPISKDRLFSLIRAGVLQLKSTAFAILMINHFFIWLMFIFSHGAGYSKQQNSENLLIREHICTH